ncbi:MAG: protein jag [Clostridia bacterium]|nr:protein jag [Clostridia bacterium]
MEEKNVFEGKTFDEALELGLNALGLTIDEVDYEVLEEGKKKLFGSVKAKIRIIPKNEAKESVAPVEKVKEEKKAAPAKPAKKSEKTEKPAKEHNGESVDFVEFLNGLLAHLGVEGSSEIVSEENGIHIEIKTTSSARVIGKHGDVLDAIQSIVGAVANIGKDEYKKVVVDCENYRAQREQTLKELALKIANKAVESGRKIILEPMTPYERRVIHSTLADNAEVKTASEGREPIRYIVVIPNNARPGDRGVRFGDRRRAGRGDRRGHSGRDGERRFDNRRREGGARPANSGAKRGKKEIHFGTFLGNSNDNKTEE